MSTKTAKQRYFRAFIPAMIGYVATVFLVSWAEDMSWASDPIKVVMSLIPAGFVFWWMWAQIRYIREVDEFIRRVQIESVLWGVIGIMAFSTAWGLMEFTGVVPAIPIFFAMPGFYLFYGLAAVVLSKRYGAGCAML